METETTESARTLWSETSFWSAWVFGTLVSTLGLISFIQHVFGIRLIPTYALGLNAYREVVHTFMGWLYWPFVWIAQYVSFKWFHWSTKIVIPGWWKDLAAVSTMCGTAFLRADKLFERARNRVTARLSIYQQLLQWFRVLLIGLTLVGLLIPISVVAIWTDHYPENSVGFVFRKFVTIALVSVLAAFAVFLATNAYQL